MAELTIDSFGAGRTPAHFFWRGSVASGENTGIVYTMAAPPISLSLAPAAGVTAAYWEYTTTPREVIADVAANATWHKWPIGDVAVADGAKADALLGPVTAVRGSTAGGACVFEVLSLVPR